MLQTPRGMHDILAPDYYVYQGFFEKASEIALYYGFKPVETPILEYADLFTAAVGQSTDIVEKEMYTLRTRGGDKLALRPEGTAGVMRAYFENGMQTEPQPVMLYYWGPFFRHDKPQRGRFRQFWQFSLEIIGTPKSIADATIIKIVSLILAESGLKNLKLQINSIGDKDCRPIYRRELTTYYRRHIKELCRDCQERLRYNPLRLLDCKKPQCQTLKQTAPAPMDYLCTGCKTHFREVLEYLENLGVIYEINNQLVRGLDYYTRTVFEMVENEQKEDGEPPLALAGGGRYDYLARALGSKQDVAAVGVSIGMERLLLAKNFNRPSPRIIKKPKVFFIQLSFEAKLKSLAVVEILRKAKIPIAQSLVKDSLGAQLGIAEKMQVPYTVILGHKEAMDGTVIVRHMTDRSQETVKIEKLADYLKKC